MYALSRPVARATLSPVFIRSISVSHSIMGAGDTGSPKPRGFLAEKDQFTRREAAQEALYIRAQEMEKLKILRAKLKQSQNHMEELDKYLEEYSKSQGGEQN
ncbi:ATPase inhibitor [Penicillium cinerascens]|uniref:ATPase inhibitor, mitochondrial n=1 Tax=Penicillium cinerascens TaxID=70096 RepID=A0A9W9N349_9EURO|nr:ATPase inhibitor [Penicillium cinerascens]KAJ5212380.1 ATPase inhibitor [Penicillium cinerascens]